MLKQTTDEDLLYSTMNSAQDSVTTLREKEFEKEEIQVCVRVRAESRPAPRPRGLHPARIL